MFTRTRWVVGAITTIAAAMTANVAFAQTAGMLSFQGLLKDAGGNPINGSVTLQFRIYDAQTGGNLVDMDGDGTTAAQDQAEANVGQDVKEASATVSNGIVSAKFGPVSPKAFNGNARWLEVRVNGTALSRMELAGAPATAEQVNKPASGAPALNVDAGGNIGIGTASPGQAVHIQGSDHTKMRIQSTGDDKVVGVEMVTTGEHGAHWQVQNNGLLSDRLEFREVNSGVTAMSLLLATDAFETPIGTVRTPYSFVAENLAGEARAYIQTRRDPVAQTEAGCIGIRDAAGNETISLHGDDGHMTSKVIHITGGSDLAEPFAVAKTNNQEQKIEPGMVIVIDPDNAGQLKLATEPYDRKVAGVISGANGLKPGMVMTAAGNPATRPAGDGSTSADHPVALAGRVYVWADASFGAIEPGDMLTTSTTAGHAMRADGKKDFPRGCVIGKAMSRLDSGKGLVLVLVQPQ